MARLRDIKGLTITHAIEINFVIKKFLELPLSEQRQIYYALSVGRGHPQYVTAGVRLASLLHDYGHELVTFFNLQFSPPSPFGDYLPGLTDGAGAAVIAQYFFTHLNQRDDMFSIETIDITK